MHCCGAPESCQGVAGGISDKTEVWVKVKKKRGCVIGKREIKLKETVVKLKENDG